VQEKITSEAVESQSLIRWAGDCSVASAAELKGLLLQGLASGKELTLDLEGVEEADVCTLQLLWAARREATRAGVVVTARLSEPFTSSARDAGFEEFSA
jgi:hypothetical protein